MPLLYESTGAYLRFCLNFVVRILIVTCTWLAACGIIILGHRAFGLIAGDIVSESTVRLMQGLFIMWLLAAATVNTVINTIDTVDLVRVHWKASRGAPPE